VRRFRAKSKRASCKGSPPRRQEHPIRERLADHFRSSQKAAMLCKGRHLTTLTSSVVT